jgi:hypothetical protein
MTRPFGLFGTSPAAGRTAAHRSANPEVRRYRPTVESLEDRVVLAAALAAPPLAPALLAPAGPLARQQATSILPIVVNSVTAKAGSCWPTPAWGPSTSRPR